MREQLRHWLGLGNGLFWRTFLLLTLLITISMASWIASLKNSDINSRAHQISTNAVQLINIIKLSVGTLTDDQRTVFFQDISKTKNIVVKPRSDNDIYKPLDENALSHELEKKVSLLLDSHTIIASEVNRTQGLWISFDFKEQKYWLKFDEQLVTKWWDDRLLSWGILTLVLNLLGAAFITYRINQPLSKISRIAHLIAHGKRPPLLPESGPKEIIETNASINRMVDDLIRNDEDRAVILAGISHDLRTPITRMKLEIEMANLNAQSRRDMQSDLTQMEDIINQFLDYARPLENLKFEKIHLSEMLKQVARNYENHPNLKLRVNIAEDYFISGDPIEIRRAFINIIENAIRYGKTANQEFTQLDIHCVAKKKETRQTVLISFRDYGSGIPEVDMSRMLKPFSRADSARSQADGTGLGLAIVDRVIKRHHGKLKLSNHKSGGFVVAIAFIAIT